MCYRCDLCNDVVPPNEPRRVHPVKRANGQILKELATCGVCHLRLLAGEEVNRVAEDYRQQEVVSTLMVAITTALLAPPTGVLPPKPQPAPKALPPLKAVQPSALGRSAVRVPRRTP